jgi:hypothetical protein
VNPFTSTTLNYALVQERRHTFEQAAARRRLVRFSSRAHRSAPSTPGRPPDPLRLAPVLTLVDISHSDPQHLPAASVGGPTTTRVA